MNIRKFKNGKDFYNKFVEYVNDCKEKEKLVNVSGFCVYSGINRDTFYLQKNLYPEELKKINDLIEDEALNCKCLGDARVIFYMKNKCGYKDRQELELNEIPTISDDV